MVAWALPSFDLRCVGCGLPRGLDELRGASERCIIRVRGVQVHLAYPDHACPACGERRFRLRYGRVKQLPVRGKTKTKSGKSG